MRPAVLFFAVFTAACAPTIGDECETSIDCSVNGDRVCDTAQPGGYCTILACEPDTCPDDAICVEWRGEPGRTAVSYCMRVCEGGGDCRNGQACVGPDDRKLREDYPNDSDADPKPLARIVDLNEEHKAANFCVYDPG